MTAPSPGGETAPGPGGEPGDPRRGAPTPAVPRRVVLGAAGAAFLAGCTTAPRAAPASSGPGRPSTATEHSPAAASTTSGTPAAPAGPAAYVANGSRSGSAVALTFHGSGDVGLTQQLLAAARQLSAPITVFGVGTWMAANPGVARQIVAGGHTLGNHTYTHPDLASLGSAAVADEIDRCAAVLEQVEGTNGRWFRPSGVVVPSALILTQAGAAQYTVSVGYDVDPLDYEDPGASVIVARVAQALRPGSIVSLHTGHAGTIEAFPQLVRLVRARHLEPVRIGDLLTQGGSP